MTSWQIVQGYCTRRAAHSAVPSTPSLARLAPTLAKQSLFSPSTPFSRLCDDVDDVVNDSEDSSTYDSSPSRASALPLVHASSLPSSSSSSSSAKSSSLPLTTSLPDTISIDASDRLSVF